MLAKPVRCDILCRVIDNFGDLGVSWRLAQQLAHEQGWQVRLWVDDWACVERLVPVEFRAASNRDAALCVRPWSDAPPSVIGHVLIEAFACDVPAAWLAQMASAAPPLWLNLEYLSAEDWVCGCHALPSPHPATGLRKYFFFPGFTPDTGGLIKEADLQLRQQRFAASEVAQAKFWQRLMADSPPAGVLRCSLFAYAQAPFEALFDAWAKAPDPVFCALTAGWATAAYARWSGQNLSAGEGAQAGALTVLALPFLSQHDYDQLQWACALNFVRGEDSFVRAQWAEKPFVWHIYPQQDQAHLIKLAAFAEHYCAGLKAPAASAWRRFQQVWTQGGDVAPAWQDLRGQLPVLAAHAPIWREKLDLNGSLASNLADFCAALLK